VDNSKDGEQILPKIPPFIFDIRVTSPSIRGPAVRVPSTDATKEDRFVAPTPTTEKLYGGAEKICDRVREIPTSHEMHVVKRRTAQRTGGDAIR
jgi:hypothetical protein